MWWNPPTGANQAHVQAKATATGLPVLATRSGGADYVLESGDGVLVPARDPDALASGLVSVKNLAAASDASAIRARCLDRFSGAVVVEQLVRLYEESSELKPS